MHGSNRSKVRCEWVVMRQRTRKNWIKKEEFFKIKEVIRDRLVNGFKNWNDVYNGWLEWLNTLFEPDAHYNFTVII